MKESVDFLRAQHHQLCFENGDHPDEIDTAYSHAADALERFPYLADERDALRAENDLLKAQLEAAREMHPAEPGLLRKRLAQKREPSSNP